MIDARLVPEEHEALTPGEAVAGMLLHGVGFSHRPLSFTPQFFAHTPLDLVFHEGVHADLCNRFPLGRTLDEVSGEGGERLLSALAWAIWTQEGMDPRFHHLDPTRFSLRGADGPEHDEHAITITQGDAKDPRPDWPQAVVALRVSPDGGVPFVSKSWEGQASETQIFQERAAALRATLQRSPTPRSLGADANLSTEDHAAHLKALGVLTRLPHTLTLVSPVLPQALREATWQRLHATTR